MAEPLFEEYRYRRYRNQFIIFLIACVAFCTGIYMPFYYLLVSNVAFAESPLILVWMEIVEPLMNYVFYLGSFAYVIFGALRFGPGRGLRLMTAYIVASFLRYATNVLSYMWTMGAIRWSEFVEFELGGILFSTLIDWVQIGIMFWMIHAQIVRRRMRVEDCMPFPKILGSRGNRLLRLAFLVAIIPAATQVLSRAYYDFHKIVILEFQVQGWPEIILMISYYLTDLLAIPVGYMVIAWILRRLYRGEEKVRALWEAEQNPTN
ncbi:MAG: hypothetical protein IJW30_02285 [Clostridia bacterium]|nr:hypothetical protein [Clostridia bacterium]